MAPHGFHAGEIEVQAKAGVRAVAQSRVGMLAPADLPEGMVRFLATRTFTVLAGRDAGEQLWATALEGPPGFLEAGPDWLRVHATPRRGDPLHGLAIGGALGLIAIEFATRRRLRLNGTLTGTGAGEDVLEIALDQAFGNCPKYIHPRTLVTAQADDCAGPDPTPTSSLAADQVAFIEAADTFFLGTTHPERGTDVSHKGGPTGLVRVTDGALWWPDYVGNDMFTSFGNLRVDDTAALFFADYASGRTLHLTGNASLEWDAPTETGRAVRFTVGAVRWGVPLRQRAAEDGPSS